MFGTEESRERRRKRVDYLKNGCSPTATSAGANHAPEPLILNSQSLQSPPSSSSNHKPSRQLTVKKFVRASSFLEGSSDDESTSRDSPVSEINKEGVAGEDTDIRRELRKIRNRESASLSRKRKAEEMQSMQQRVEELETEVSVLRRKLMNYETPEPVDYNYERTSMNETTCRSMLSHCNNNNNNNHFHMDSAEILF
jgi:hypothetical protein